MVIASSHFHQAQRRHFLLFDVLPALGTLAAAGLAFLHPVSAIDLELFGIFWLLTGLGISVGYHRLFSHRAFETTRPLAAALLICGSMAGRGPMLSWVAMHRRHHERTDREGDMHSPNLHGPGWRGRLRGWLHAHLSWMMRHDYPNLAHYAPDLLRDSRLLRLNSRYYAWVLLGLLAPAACGGLLSASWYGALSGFLWGGAVRMFAVEQTMSAINSVQHLLGTRPFDLPVENSRNGAVLGILAWGEGWHNNHHAFPYSAAFGLRWYQLDLGYGLILLLKAGGLAWDVKRPGPDRIQARLAELAD